jgi:uncharacterized protein YjiS (DUF1127 family)
MTDISHKNSNQSELDSPGGRPIRRIGMRWVLAVLGFLKRRRSNAIVAELSPEQLEDIGLKRGDLPRPRAETWFWDTNRSDRRTPKT